jgi:hypothetical protein
MILARCEVVMDVKEYESKKATLIHKLDQNKEVVIFKSELSCPQR